jgi:hypothetical protein
MPEKGGSSHLRNMDYILHAFISHNFLELWQLRGHHDPVRLPSEKQTQRYIFNEFGISVIRQTRITYQHMQTWKMAYS